MKQATTYGKTVLRGIGLVLEDIAIEDLKEIGMTVSVLSESTVRDFRNIVLPKCLEWEKKQMDAKWVDGLVKATKGAEAKLGY